MNSQTLHTLLPILYRHYLGQTSDTIILESTSPIFLFEIYIVLIAMLLLYAQTPEWQVKQYPYGQTLAKG